MTKGRTPASSATRRRFVLAAGVTAASAVAMPQVSRAQTLTWRYQSIWPAKDIFHEMAADYAKKIDDMSGGRLKLNVLAAGAVVPAFQLPDAVHAGILDAGHGGCAHWYAKHKAYALFGAPPSFGWDAHGFLAWFYSGGGEALYKELVNDILKLNLVGFLYFPMPRQPLGWFNKEIKSGDDFKGLKYRTTGLAANLFRELGAAVTVLPGGEIATAMERGVIDAAEFSNPSSDRLLRLPDVFKFYMLGSNHEQLATFEVIFNKSRYAALPAELRAILRNAALAASSDQLGLAYDRFSKDLEEIKKRGVQVVKTDAAVLNAQLAAWDRVIAELSKEPFFAKVIESQKAWVKRTSPYLQINNLDSNALATAYKHFFG
jgi:TRAP-type mannitol/chloroaromatic compound transport system substrate-binding protein